MSVSVVCLQAGQREGGQVWMRRELARLGTGAAHEGNQEPLDGITQISTKSLLLNFLIQVKHPQPKNAPHYNKNKIGLEAKTLTFK